MKKGSVVVVGAGPGLGSSLAKKFASKGHHVYVARRQRNEAQLESLCEEIIKSGGIATSIPTDARKEEEVKSLFVEVAKLSLIHI